MPKSSTSGRPDLQIDDDLAYQERTWLVQRVGWGVFAALIVVALAGLLGSGPLSSATVGAPADGLQITYERFARLHAPTAFEIRANRNLARNGELSIALSGDAVRSLELPSSMPPPDGAGVVPDGVLLHFKVDNQPGELTVVLYAKPQRAGFLESRVAVAGGPAHTISQLIYP